MKIKGALGHTPPADLGPLWFCRAMEYIALVAEQRKLSWLNAHGTLKVSTSTDDYSIWAQRLADVHDLKYRVLDNFEDDEWAIMMHFDEGTISYWSPGA